MHSEKYELNVKTVTKLKSIIIIIQGAFLTKLLVVIMDGI